MSHAACEYPSTKEPTVLGVSTTIPELKFTPGAFAGGDLWVLEFQDPEDRQTQGRGAGNAAGTIKWGSRWGKGLGGLGSPHSLRGLVVRDALRELGQEVGQHCFATLQREAGKGQDEGRGSERAASPMLRRSWSSGHWVPQRSRAGGAKAPCPLP